MPFNNKIAFFDVDETIINCKSMFDFQEFYYVKKYGYTGKIIAKLYWKIVQLLAYIKVYRTKINTFYYWLYKGKRYQDIKDIGVQWYKERKCINAFFRKESLQLIDNLRTRGYSIVFVSGSFRPCLEPIGEELNAVHILCAELEVKNDIVTGHLTQKAIGKYKQELVSSYLSERNISPMDCYAVGDHISDFDMLNLVGNPIVVQNCQQLVTIAKQNKWQII